MEALRSDLMGRRELQRKTATEVGKYLKGKGKHLLSSEHTSSTWARLGARVALVGGDRTLLVLKQLPKVHALVTLVLGVFDFGKW